ncbi:MAG: hypothetical protein KF688_15655 [Pirellulales bacterium]|nr:hypothetical protein [Pirellulales bacterium]
MLVELEAGRCRECSGQLEIEEVDDATMTVVCLDCSDSHSVKTDAFNVRGIRYWPAMMAQQEDGEQPHLRSGPAAPSSLRDGVCALLGNNPHIA